MFKKRAVKGTSVGGGTHTKRRKLPASIEHAEVVVDTQNAGLTKVIEVSRDDDKYRLSSVNEATKEDRLNSEVLQAKKLMETSASSSVRATFSMKGKSLTKKIVQPSNVRTTLLMDYQPDVCKDYQKTGYCGYGDSCKFLHSRDDFKSGWKLNQEWKIDEHGETQLSSASTNSKFDPENVPFKCIICKGDYKSPVVTACGHYFCSSCFTKRIRETPKCAICGKDTEGTAKIALDLKKHLGKVEKGTAQKEKGKW